jgi:hypothetical protein
MRPHHPAACHAAGQYRQSGARGLSPPGRPLPVETEADGPFDFARIRHQGGHAKERRDHHAGVPAVVPDSRRCLRGSRFDEKEKTASTRTHEEKQPRGSSMNLSMNLSMDLEYEPRDVWDRIPYYRVLADCGETVTIRGRRDPAETPVATSSYSTQMPGPSRIRPTLPTLKQEIS